MLSISKIARFVFPLLVCIVPWGAATAASSQWTDTPGGRVRFLVDTPQKAVSTVAGAIEIRLAPGWKTYWRNPGDTGVPPSLHLSGSTNIEGATISFPPPQRYEDGEYTWAGYEAPVSFPVTLTIADPGKPARIAGSFFLGVCHDICVPVEAKFDVPIKVGAQDPLAHTLVLAAQSRLPKPATPDFGVVSARRDGDMLTLEARLPQPGAAAELFLSGGEELMLGTPKLVSSDEGGARFSAPITGGTHEKDATSVRLIYTLTQNGRSSAGEIATR